MNICWKKILGTGEEGIVCIEGTGEVAGIGKGSLGEEASDWYFEENAGFGYGSGKSSSS